jgi:putative nucleotidyltransferase with HDIG domain
MKIKILYKYLVLLGVAIYFNLIFLPPIGGKRFNLKEGEIANEDIIAPYDFIVPKSEEELTEERNAIARRLPPVYNYEPAVGQNVESAISQLETIIDTLKNQYSNDSIIYLIQKNYGLPRDVVLYLLKNNYKYVLKKLLKELSFYLSKGIIADKSLPYRILIVSRGDKEAVISVDEIYSVAEVESLLSMNAPDAHRSLIRYFLKPNILFNKEETEKRIEEVFANVKKTKGEVLKGELIVEKHKRVDRTALEKISALEKTYSTYGIWQILKNFLFHNIFLIGLYMFLIYYSHLTNSNFFEDRNLYFIVFLIVIYLAIGKITYELKAVYILPAAFFVFLFSLFFNYYTGIFFAIILGAIFGVMYNSLPVFIFLLVNGIAAGIAVQSLKSRYLLYRPVLYLSLVNVITIIFIDNYLSRSGVVIVNVGSGVINGFISVVCLAIFLPILERIFDFTTDFTLLELGNLNLPIFKEMSINAPGTYHHSVVVGNLAEAGARAIGANPILARVGAYYHDIGKLKKPEYFIENQIGQKNPHDNLKPQMSALVIISHVKDGVEMGKAMKLPKKILSIIEEHHGTSRIESFYRKALHSSEKVSEEIFNYPGPKPRTKEAALVMLADSIEAAARAEKNITVSKIQKILKENFDKKFNEGQLDDSPISRVDLEHIKTAFLPIMLGVFHPRIDYEEEKEINQDRSV